MTPGQHQKHYLAGALKLTTGTLHHCVGPLKTHALFRALLTQLEARYPEDRSTRLYVVVDNYKIHTAKAVEQSLATHPRVTLLFWPTHGPRANPMEEPLLLNGPWQNKLSHLYYEPAVVAAVEKITPEGHATVAA